MKITSAGLSLALSLSCISSMLLAQAAALPQTQPAPTPPIRSVEVHPDRTITFRYRAPHADKMTVGVDVLGTPLEMEKDDQGVWSVTTQPMPPSIYAYHFTVDGLTRLDAANPRFAPNLVGTSNLIEVPGDVPQPWDATNVPHGEVHHHFYNTAVVVGLANNQSDYFVYTPPNYNAKAKKAYPVLYLLHGWSDDASGWTSVGQANLILDNLIAQGKIKPMVVAMPLGYGDMGFVRDRAVWSQGHTSDNNVSLFQKVLLTEVLPQVEAAYNVSRKRDERAIVGLSMGGLESLTTGLTHTDLFAYVGGFSSGLRTFNADSQFLGLDPKKANLKLLWIACGTEDQLITPNREFISWLKTKNIR